MDKLALAHQDQAERPTYQLLVVAAAVIFLVLPLVTTFNEFLTSVVMRLGLDRILQWVVPVETRMVAALLRPLGIQVGASDTSVYLATRSRSTIIYIAWNCVGWQSFILFAITLLTGLQGPYTLRSKIESVVLGFLGTFLVNLLRIASVCVVALCFGQLPAIIYHDYGGTIIILLWLFAFWYFTYNYVLEPAPVEADEEMELAYPEE